MTNRAIIADRYAGLWTQFGLEFASRRFPADVIAALPRYQRGKRKGHPKAVIVWEKVERGGWASDGASFGDGANGHVERRVGQIIRVALYGVGPWGSDLPYQGLIAEHRPEELYA